MKNKYNFEVQKSDEEWQKILSEEEFRILRKAGTEYPGSGKYYLNEEEGEYRCRACDNVLFSSSHKYHSGCGWPAFFDVADESKIIKRPDLSHGMMRTEILCAKCGSHLGHVFDDGPEDKTGIRYCINSASLDFDKKEKE